MFTKYDLKEKVVLITGASGGIGGACAKAFHEAGARVVAVARSADKLDALAQGLGGNRVLAVPADITDAAQREHALHETVERFGAVDVLVNNAGWASFSSALRLPMHDLTAMVTLNFVAPVALIQAVLPGMIERKQGQIINVSSVVAIQPIPRMSVYSATKAALSTLTIGLRMELAGTGIDVLLIAPGSTRTDFFNHATTIDTGIVRFANTQDSPDRVARAVVRSSRRRRRAVTLGAQAKAITLLRRISTRLADAIMYHVAARSMPLKEPNDIRQEE